MLAKVPVRLALVRLCAIMQGFGKVSQSKVVFGKVMCSKVGLYTQKKIFLKKEENASSKFLSQYPLNLRVNLSS